MVASLRHLAHLYASVRGAHPAAPRTGIRLPTGLVERRDRRLTMLWRGCDAGVRIHNVKQLIGAKSLQIRPDPALPEVAET